MIIRISLDSVHFFTLNSISQLIIDNQHNKVETPPNSVVPNPYIANDDLLANFLTVSKFHPSDTKLGQNLDSLPTPDPYKSSVVGIDNGSPSIERPEKNNSDSLNSANVCGVSNKSMTPSKVRFPPSPSIALPPNSLSPKSKTLARLIEENFGDDLNSSPLIPLNYDDENDNPQFHELHGEYIERRPNIVIRSQTSPFRDVPNTKISTETQKQNDITTVGLDVKGEFMDAEKSTSRDGTTAIPFTTTKSDNLINLLTPDTKSHRSVPGTTHLTAKEPHRAFITSDTNLFSSSSQRSSGSPSVSVSGSDKSVFHFTNTQNDLNELINQNIENDPVSVHNYPPFTHLNTNGNSSDVPPIVNTTFFKQESELKDRAWSFFVQQALFDFPKPGDDVLSNPIQQRKLLSQGLSKIKSGLEEYLKYFPPNIVLPIEEEDENAPFIENQHTIDPYSSTKTTVVDSNDMLSPSFSMPNEAEGDDGFVDIPMSVSFSVKKSSPSSTLSYIDVAGEVINLDSSSDEDDDDDDDSLNQVSVSTDNVSQSVSDSISISNKSVSSITTKKKPQAITILDDEIPDFQKMSRDKLVKLTRGFGLKATASNDTLVQFLTAKWKLDNGIVDSDDDESDDETVFDSQEKASESFDSRGENQKSKQLVSGGARDTREQKRAKKRLALEASLVNFFKTQTSLTTPGITLWEDILMFNCINLTLVYSKVLESSIKCHRKFLEEFMISRGIVFER